MTTPYRVPSLKAQFGLAEDPNAPAHITTSAGHKLTRTITPGGHELDSTQPGFPVYHRRIANPVPLMSIATGASLMILGFGLCKIRNIENYTIWYTVGLPLGMVGNFTASMFAFAEGSTFLATLAGTLAGLLGGLAICFLPWAGVQASYVVGAAGNIQQGTLDFYTAVSMVTLVGMVPLFCILLASLRSSVPVTQSITLIIIALILEGVNNLQYPRPALQTAGGVIFIIVGVTLEYLAVAVMLQEEGLKLLPVMPLPRVE
ncbi:uncharacterized protein PFL1_02066 [Pseudozyma flocculosa PF-1]|uniref:Uncharacterized protein n=1 Tax=Pseudozyma flocculosa TaxID=84751 RepID=A0A5C3EZY9_9BASI|nr:uncharacterized protein PFL1_02066 [Pseudozyma flocculosa PF-1]EPQ30541.1 hypothetical protein PFL1_02066 [Pseudozyma flocculosa PF-1]SPO37632.1 uncharacterized protein PSFLO_03107 [Pseudozyma flocculosa]